MWKYLLKTKQPLQEIRVRLVVSYMLLSNKGPKQNQLYKQVLQYSANTQDKYEILYISQDSYWQVHENKAKKNK